MFFPTSQRFRNVSFLFFRLKTVNVLENFDPALLRRAMTKSSDSKLKLVNQSRRNFTHDRNLKYLAEARTKTCCATILQRTSLIWKRNSSKKSRGCSQRSSAAELWMKSAISRAAYICLEMPARCKRWLGDELHTISGISLRSPFSLKPNPYSQ